MIRRFNRYELKYVVPSSQYRALVHDLRHFMSPDTHGDGDGFYRICSLYYDSPDLAAYRSKIEGLKYRRKLRLRIYPGEDITKVTKCFVEIKQRINRTVQKRRLKLSLEDGERLCSGQFLAQPLDELDQAVASEVIYMVKAQNMTPKCIVSYRRQAFVGSRYESGMRVTFDMQLQGRTHALKVNEDAKNYYFFPPDFYVMEVKVNERIPDWMTTLIARHECQLQRVSKYVAAMSTGMSRFRFALANKELNIYG
jgi:SPX domain protein involved in polyphosphate accumulation